MDTTSPMFTLILFSITVIGCWVNNTTVLAQDAGFYAGPRIGMMITSPGTYDDNGAVGALFGYQIRKCCWAIEVEVNTTVTNRDWEGSSLGVFGVFRSGRIGSDFFFFFPMAKLGLVQNRFARDGGVLEKKNYLGIGVGVNLGDENYTIEIEFSGAATASLGSDEVIFFRSVFFFHSELVMKFNYGSSSDFVG